MIITTASATKIENVSDYHHSDFLLGCLFFGREGNEYNLVGECNYQYNIDVDEEKILNISRLEWEIDCTEGENEVIDDVLRNFGESININYDEHRELLLAIITEELTDREEIENELCCDDFCENFSWKAQQFQGILAHRLGYDCAESFDEQGVVYIAYCVDRKMEAA